MSFMTPELLWLLLAVPLLVAGYVHALRRRKKDAVRYASLDLVKEAMGPSRLRRHIPPVLFLLGMTALLIAVARPAAMRSSPTADDLPCGMATPRRD